MKLLLLLFVLFLASCKKEDENGVMCTTQFETIQISIPKFKLDKYHTIRLATGDTLSKDSSWRGDDNHYPVVDDSFQKILKNRTETFRFQGFIGDSLVVSEDIRISADVCHIFYVSGKLKFD